jgi:hypothetical protein
MLSRAVLTRVQHRLLARFGRECPCARYVTRFGGEPPYRSAVSAPMSLCGYRQRNGIAIDRAAFCVSFQFSGTFVRR